VRATDDQRRIRIELRICDCDRQPLYICVTLPRVRNCRGISKFSRPASHLLRLQRQATATDCASKTINIQLLPPSMEKVIRSGVFTSTTTKTKMDFDDNKFIFTLRAS